MKDIYNKLTKVEALPLILKELYEARGYEKYIMGEFVPYEIYMENKNFLRDEGIITFTGANGKLMALKPDVTMSVVKNITDNTITKKIYYYENVFRMSKSINQYEEIGQIGVEFIGGEDLYSSAEVIELACKSLESISNKYILSINDMGFMSGLIRELNFDEEAEYKLLKILKSKSQTELKGFCKKYGHNDRCFDYLAKIVKLEGPFNEVLEDAKGLCLNDEMTIALDELNELYEALISIDLGGNIKLDLSIVNDLDYYNGIIFKGYVDGIPAAVLSGGRYDNLMRRLNKKQAAVGFAIYLSHLDRIMKTDKKYDAEAVLFYNKASTADVIGAVNKLSQKHESVRAEKEDYGHIKACYKYVLVDGEIKEAEDNA
jgi:ATP phosphoribosyltransferase regulatory subunit